MTYFPRVRPALGVSRACGVTLAALLAVLVGVLGSIYAAGAMR
jgi:hypothetical protein